MIRLTSSNDRQEVETLKRKLFKAGIRSEIRGNPLANVLGITRHEVFVDERDMLRASKVRHDLQTVVSVDDADGSPGGGGGINGIVEGEEAELVTDAEVLPPLSTESPREERPGRAPETGGTEPKGEFAQATALLEKEVEELLVRESSLVNRCSSLEEKLKGLDESLAQARADLAREASNRSSVEKKLAGVCETRASFNKSGSRTSRKRLPHEIRSWRGLRSRSLRLAPGWTSSKTFAWQPSKSPPRWRLPGNRSRPN